MRPSGSETSTYQPTCPSAGAVCLMPSGVEVRAPGVEVVVVADAECDRAETVERACEFRSVVQAEAQSAWVNEDDADNAVFFFEAEARFEVEHGGIPVAAAHDVRYRQPKVMQADNGRRSDRRVVHGRARNAEDMAMDVTKLGQSAITGDRHPYVPEPP